MNTLPSNNPSDSQIAADCISDKEIKLDKEILQLKEKIEFLRKEVQDTDFYKCTESVVEIGRLKFKVRKQLRGHLAKVTKICWAADSQLLVSASQDGKLFVWDCHTGHKIHMLSLITAWVCGCGFSPNMNLICSGGLDNIVSIFDLSMIDGPSGPVKEMAGHDGYVSSCSFIDNSTILSGSGDKTCGYFDVTKGVLKSRYYGHDNDVNSVKQSVGNSNVFVSASSDKTARLWDSRVSRCQQIFEGHEQDVNDVAFFPATEYGFVTSSDDGSCRLWDIRADQSVAVYIDDYINCGSTCVDVSKSGRLVFAGYDDFNSHVWDTLREERVGIMSAHDGRVSTIGISPSGCGVGTGSWDTTCLIWTGK